MRGNSFVSFIAGAAIGAAVAILFAPDKGSVTRRRIREMAEDEKDRFLDLIDEGKEKIRDLVDQGKEKLAEIVEAERETVADAIDPARKKPRARAKNKAL